MHIESAPNRKSHPTILLRESCRADGKVKKRTLANLTHWPEQLVEGLRTLLRGGVALETADQALTISRSLPHGHVAAVLGSAELLDLPKLLTERLGGATARCYRDLVLALIVNRVIAPASKLATVRALSPTASSLGERLKLGEVADREVYDALDWLLANQDRDRAGQAPSRGRHAGALRRELLLSRGTLLRAGPVRLQPRPPVLTPSSSKARARRGVGVVGRSKRCFRLLAREFAPVTRLLWTARNPLEKPRIGRRNPRKSTPVFLVRLGLALIRLGGIWPEALRRRPFARGAPLDPRRTKRLAGNGVSPNTRSAFGCQPSRTLAA